MNILKENSLIVELRTIAELIGEEGRQAEFYRQMLRDAKPIEVVRLSEVFSPAEVKAIEVLVYPKKKQCYRNATLLSHINHIFPDVKYVEGKMTCCGAFGIEHAWNKVGDKYVDITMELALKRDQRKRSIWLWESMTKKPLLAFVLRWASMVVCIRYCITNKSPRNEKV